jgi:hypothetical protein
MPTTKADYSYKEPVFIAGMPRSGTTLLQGILCNTGIYFPMPETHFFSRVAYGLPETDFSDKDRKQVLRLLIKKLKIEMDKNLVDELHSKKDMFEYIIGFYNTNKKKTFLEKTPRHIFFYHEILGYYPDAKFMCMIREPKNCVSSVLAIPSKRKKSVIRIALLYNKISNAILKIRENRNVLVIRYEDLVDKTDAIIRNTCEFLNIPYNSALIDSVAAPSGIVTSHESWKNKNLELDTIQANNPDRWRETLRESQADMVNFITKSYAMQFNYTLNHRLRAVCVGISQDLSNLLSKGELKSVFSRVHG